MAKKKHDDGSEVPKETLEGDDLEYVNDAISKSISEYKQRVIKKAVSSQEDIDALQAILLEHLDDFLIIGHTVDERRVIMRYAPSPVRYDGLNELSRQYLIATLMNPELGEDGMSGGKGPDDVDF